MRWNRIKWFLWKSWQQCIDYPFRLTINIESFAFNKFKTIYSNLLTVFHYPTNDLGFLGWVTSFCLGAIVHATQLPLNKQTIRWTALLWEALASVCLELCQTCIMSNTWTSSLDSKLLCSICELDQCVAWLVRPINIRVCEIIPKRKSRAKVNQCHMRGALSECKGVRASSNNNLSCFREASCSPPLT